MSSLVSYLDRAQLQRDLSLRDLSDPAEGPHAIQIIVGQAVPSTGSTPAPRTNSTCGGSPGGR